MLAHYGRYLVSKQGTTHGSPSAPENGTPCNHIYRSYEEYLGSPLWQKVKEDSYRIWGGACLVCLGGGVMHRHHLFYREKWEDTRASEVVPLCEACHTAVHVDGANKNGLPISNEALDHIVISMVETINRARRLDRPHLLEGVKTRFWDRYPYHARLCEPKVKKSKMRRFKESKKAKKQRLKRERKKGLSRSKWLRKRDRFQWGV